MPTATTWLPHRQQSTVYFLGVAGSCWDWRRRIGPFLMSERTKSITVTTVQTVAVQLPLERSTQ
jgi:hypothetical protein